MNRRIGLLIDAWLLGRVDYAAERLAIGQARTEQDGIEGVLDASAARLASALDANRLWWVEDAAQEGGFHATTSGAVVPTTDLPRYAMRIGDLTGGRRLLSDDLALVESVVTLAARRIDQIRL